MESFFNAYVEQGFIAFSFSHLIALLGFSGIAAALYFSRSWWQQGERSKYGRYLLAAILILCEFALNMWYVRQNVYNVQDTLPLELCSISMYICTAMLLLRSRLLFQIAYFAGIGGALQALLTPVLGYPFPHFRFLQFFMAHSAIILSALYMVWVEKLRPTLKSIAWTMLFLNLLIIPVSLINYWTGGNYMFLARKPDSASLLDVLGPYPWYLLSMEAVALILFFLLYAPFAITDWISRRSVKPQ
ncbi:YwaF family protein [Paenibacillus senegalensis]|uniref:YwaF family protein n=1 Tax=Paenibacillus senegalensis TaxID=1465766 RepID=UPI000287E2ED|nr:TIGR02206 family membrane protein [Paenibacillus senegalensis]